MRALRYVAPFVAFAWLLQIPAHSEDAPDSAARKHCVQEFLTGDAARRNAALAEAAKWSPVPAASAKEAIELLRRYVPKRTLDLDAKKQPILRGAEKWKENGKEFEYQWVLPNHYDPSRPTPLLIYLHGSNGPQGTAPWDRWATAQGAILVAPTSPNRSYWHPVAQATDPTVYEETFFFTYLRAWREKFNLDWNRIYLSGFSAGGFGSWWFALRYPDWFAAVLPMAGGPPSNWGEYGPYEHVGKLPFWIWHGEKDTEVPPDLDRSGVQWLRKLGTPCEYKEYPGGDHNTWFPKDPSIGTKVQEIIQELRRDPFPKRVVWSWYESFYTIFPGATRVMGAWWLAIGEHGEYSRLEGEITAPNVIELRSREVKSVRIRVLADAFDLSRPLEVKWSGKTVFQGEVQVDFALMLREFDARPDPWRIVVAEIPVKSPSGK